MRIVGPGSRSKGGLSVKEIISRVRSELLFLIELKKEGLSPEEEHERLHELLVFYLRELKKLPLPQAIELMHKTAAMNVKVLEGKP